MNPALPSLDDSTLKTLRKTLTGRVLDWAHHFPQRVALREKERGIWKEYTWAQYYQHIAAVGLMLHHHGIKPGDSIAILSDNRPEWLYVDLGAQGIGARSVGIYQTNPPADVAYVLNHSQSPIVFCEDQEQIDKVIEVAEETPHLKEIVLFDPRGTRNYTDARIIHWEDFLKQGLAKLTEQPTAFLDRLLERDPTEASMVVYTSGTTGPPKGALISSANVLPIAEGTARELGVTENDTVLSYLPLCHVAEKIFSVFLPLTTGGIVHFGESIYTVQDDLREVSPTIFLGVPRIWEKINANVDVKMRDSSWLKRMLYQIFVRWGQQIAEHKLKPGHKLSTWNKIRWWLADLLIFRALQERLGLRRCRLAFSGAAPISPNLLIWFHSIGVRIIEGFGQTECGGVSHFNRPENIQIGKVGQALPHVECKLADDGEILIGGPLVFCGYLHNPEATAQTIDQEGWLHTGDIGSIDEDGFLTITGRKKEIIITSGGKNLSPEKIENALKTSPYIKEAIAIGDQRKFISALVQIEYDTVGDWATRRRIPYTSYPDLADKPDVVQLIGDEIHKANDLLAQVESVRSFRILPKELNQDDGELTATQKVRRNKVYKKFEQLIEEIYKTKTKKPLS